LVALTALATTALVAVASAGAAKKAGGGKVVYAKKLTRILPQGKEPVLFEGGAFGPEGDFFFANVFAKAGEPKIIRLDRRRRSGRASTPTRPAFSRRRSSTPRASSG